MQSIVVTKDSRIMISGSWDTTINIWNFKTGEKICTLTGHTDPV